MEKGGSEGTGGSERGEAGGEAERVLRSPWCWRGPGGGKTGVQGKGSGKGVVRVLGLCQGVWEGLRVLGRLTQGLGLSGFLAKFLGFLARKASG